MEVCVENEIPGAKHIPCNGNLIFLALISLTLIRIRL